MAKPRTKSKKDGRLHLRVSSELEERMHDYALRHKTSLGAITETLFKQLLAAEDAEKEATKYEAEQV